MKTTERRALIAKYENKIREATRKALTGETTDEWKADLSEIDSYAKLLALPEHRWTADAGLAVLFSLLCLFVAGTLWTLKRTHNNISLVLETHNLQAALTSPWSLQKELSSPLFFVERASTLSAPDLGLDLSDTQGDAWVRLDGGTISLENLELEKRSIENDMSSGTFNNEDLFSKSERHGEIMKMLDEKELRWLELSER